MYFSMIDIRYGKSLLNYYYQDMVRTLLDLQEQMWRID
jgi:hypothetical protein